MSEIGCCSKRVDNEIIDDGNATFFAGIPIELTIPTNGDSWQYNSGLNEWELVPAPVFVVPDPLSINTLNVNNIHTKDNNDLLIDNAHAGKNIVVNHTTTGATKFQSNGVDRVTVDNTGLMLKTGSQSGLEGGATLIMDTGSVVSDHSSYLFENDGSLEIRSANGPLVGDSTYTSQDLIRFNVADPTGNYKISYNKDFFGHSGETALMIAGKVGGQSDVINYADNGLAVTGSLSTPMIGAAALAMAISANSASLADSQVILHYLANGFYAIGFQTNDSGGLTPIISFTLDQPSQTCTTATLNPTLSTTINNILFNPDKITIGTGQEIDVLNTGAINLTNSGAINVSNSFVTLDDQAVFTKNANTAGGTAAFIVNDQVSNNLCYIDNNGDLIFGSSQAHFIEALNALTINAISTLDLTAASTVTLQSTGVDVNVVANTNMALTSNAVMALTSNGGNIELSSGVDTLINTVTGSLTVGANTDINLTAVNGDLIQAAPAGDYLVTVSGNSILTSGGPLQLNATQGTIFQAVVTPTPVVGKIFTNTADSYLYGYDQDQASFDKIAFKNNIPALSRSYGIVKWTSGGTVAVTTSPAVLDGMTSAITVSNDFDSPATAVIRYTGATTKAFLVTCTFSMNATSAGSFKTRINLQPPSLTDEYYENFTTADQCVTVSSMSTLSTNDQVFCLLTAVTAGDNATYNITGFTISAMQVS